MHFLEINEITEWCRGAGLRVFENFKVELPALPQRKRLMYEEGGRPTKSASVAAECLSLMGGYKETLLWIRSWGIYASNEDWPEFYGWRGSHGERRSLEEAPGHLFTLAQSEDLKWLLTKVMDYGWDADLLCSISSLEVKHLVHVSHDGFLDVMGSE